MLFDLQQSLEKLFDKLTNFIDRNANNASFWCVFVFVVLVITAWGVQYLNRR